MRKWAIILSALLALATSVHAEEKWWNGIGIVPAPTTGGQLLISNNDGSSDWATLAGGNGNCHIVVNGIGSVSLMCPNFATINSPIFTGTARFDTIHTDNINIANSLTIGGNPVGGTCPANEFMVALSTGLKPTCLPISIHSGSTAPSNPIDGQLWYDTSTSQIKMWNGTTWVSVGGSGGVVINVTPPANATEGQLWFDPTSLQTYIRYNGQWVAVVNIGGGGGTGSATTGPTPPSNPTTGMLWYDTTTGQLKIWNGSAWASTGGGGGSPASVTDTMLASSYSGVGACPANQFVIALTRNAAPTCAGITSLPSGLTLNNPTFTGTVTMPDSSTWGSTGIIIAPGSRSSTLDSLTGTSGTTTGALTRAANGTWSVSSGGVSGVSSFNGRTGAVNLIATDLYNLGFGVNTATPGTGVRFSNAVKLGQVTIQYGFGSIDGNWGPNSSTSTTIYFPTTFSGQPYYVGVTPDSLGTGGWTLQGTASALGPNSASFYFYNPQGSGMTHSGLTFWWMAIGPT